MAEIYSKSTNFGDNINPGQLHEEILADETITTTFLGIVMEGDVVNINFQSAISSEERTALNTLITNHVPDTTVRDVIPTHAYLTTTRCDSSQYKRVGAFEYRGEIYSNIPQINIVGYRSSKVDEYCVRIFDVTHGKVMAEKTMSNTDEEIINLGEISNIPNEKSLFEIHMCTIGGKRKKYAYLLSVTFYVI